MLLVLLSGRNLFKHIFVVFIVDNKILSKPLLLILLFVVVLTILNAVLFFVLLKHNEYSINSKYSLIYPYVVDEPDSYYARYREQSQFEYAALKNNISNIHLLNGENYSFYFEDLNTGVSVGVNDRVPYFPLSLRKVPLVAAVYKQIHNGAFNLSDRVLVISSDIDHDYGPMADVNNKTFTIRELLWYTTYYSDNTAADVLLRVVGQENYHDALIRLGISINTDVTNSRNIDYPLSTREYSNIFRSLYFSTYLTHSDSEQVLYLLSNTSFVGGLRAGVPPNIVVSHKTAYLQDGDQNHDCGIVYYPGHPYILCVMTIGMSEERFSDFMNYVSQLSYAHVNNIVVTE